MFIFRNIYIKPKNLSKIELSFICITLFIYPLLGGILKLFINHNSVFYPLIPIIWFLAVVNFVTGLFELFSYWKYKLES